MRNASPRFLLTILFVVVALCALASATESGASVYPVGVDTVMNGMQPHPGQTSIYEYTCNYSANELDDAHGKKLPIPDFKLRVQVEAIKLTHNWGWHLLGGTVATQFAVPFTYEQLHVPVMAVPKSTKFSIGNADLVPVTVTYNKGIAHWYYEADLFGPGAGYSLADAKAGGLNIGQHNMALGFFAGDTFLLNKGKTEISTKQGYLINGYDSAMRYHSGNEFTLEFNVDQAVTKKLAIGFNGDLYKQVTDDHQYGAVYDGGNRGRDLQIGPQVRYAVGHHGGMAFKYYRDTLVQNKTRGNAFWFQIAVPFNGLSSKPEKR
jgi:hypothetical protein